MNLFISSWIQWWFLGQKNVYALIGITVLSLVEKSLFRRLG